MTSPKLIDIIHQITRRYRHALLANLSVLAVLSLGIAGVLAWRLHAIGFDREWVVGIPGALAIAAAATLGWLLRRRWMSGEEAASRLDRALGLQERLLTAAEFAHRTPPPALYALLVEDAARHFSTGRVRFPRVLDRPGIVLAIVLLVLLCWPGRGNVPMRLAQLPTTQPPPPPPPPPPEQRQQTADSRQQTEQGQGGPSQPQAAGERGQEGGQQSQPQGSGSDQQAGQGASQPSQGQQQGQGSDQPSPGSGQQQPGSGNRHEQPAQAGRDRMSREEGPQGPHRAPQTADKKQEAGDQKEQQGRSSRDQMKGERGEQDGGEQRKGSTPQGSQPQRSQSQGSQPQAAGSDKQQAADGAKPAGQQGGEGRAQPIPSNTQQAGQSGGQSVAGEVTRAQIQQLLKEVSQELKQLQAQLAAANDEPAPEPGTSTDPELYGAPEPLDRATGRPLPVQLETDTTETTAERPGGGVGKPSGEASSAAPQVQAEDAQLSEQPLEETPAGRQTIPPEYRPIFERLHQQRDTTR